MKWVRGDAGQWCVADSVTGEAMHPLLPALEEADAIYVEPVRRFFGNSVRWNVWDVGLGMGANALALIIEAEKRGIELELTSFDLTLEPLSMVLESSESEPEIGPNEFSKWRDHSAPRSIVERGFWKSARIDWKYIPGDFSETLDLTKSQALHAVFFDPFSKVTNPDLWTDSIVTRLARHRPEMIVSYSVATSFRASLWAEGYHVLDGPGHSNKKATTLAIHSSLMPESTDAGESFLKHWQRSGSRFPSDIQSSEARAAFEKKLRACLLLGQQFL